MVNVQTVIGMIIAFGGLRILEEGLKHGVNVLKQKLGQKKYNQLIETGKIIIADVEKTAEVWGKADDIEMIEKGILNKFCKVTGIEENTAKEFIEEAKKQIEDTETQETPATQPGTAQPVTTQAAQPVPTEQPQAGANPQ